MPIDIEILLAAWMAVGVLGAFATLVVGYLRWGRERRAEPPPPARAPRSEEPLRAQPSPSAAEAPLAPPPLEPTPPPLRADLRSGLRKTRQALLGPIEALLRGRSALDADLIDEIETLLFGADLGVRTADELLQAAKDADSAERVREALEARALEILRSAPHPAVTWADAAPHVVLVVGVNGTGKTTTIGKLARRYAGERRKVVLAAADTFRAAAVDQLGIWADRAGATLVKGEPGGDPAAVAFDAVRAAKAQAADVVIVDTAGRLQTHAGLMDELKKIGRAVGKQHPGAPHEVLLVLDANTGQNAIRQAQEFTRSTGVTGLVLTKLDGTARGGVVLGICQELGVPVRYVGVGEGIDDLLDFDPEKFVEALFASG